MIRFCEEKVSRILVVLFAEASFRCSPYMLTGIIVRERPHTSPIWSPPEPGSNSIGLNPKRRCGPIGNFVSGAEPSVVDGSTTSDSYASVEAVSRNLGTYRTSKHISSLRFESIGSLHA